MAKYGEILLEKKLPACLPLDPPPFTLRDIKNAIPAHCFKRSALMGFYHLFLDLAFIAMFFYLATKIDHLESILSTFLNENTLYVNKVFGSIISLLVKTGIPEDMLNSIFTISNIQQYILPYLQYFAWPLYWYWQGAVCTGVWVIAHECGHQSFSESKFLNDSVGWVLHSSLLVPYHSWRISHSKHHGNTGSCEHDEVFAPKARDDLVHEIIEHSPLYNAIKIFGMLTVGWMPAYLLFNATGPKKYEGKINDHFNPKSEIFSSRDYWDIVSSDLGFGLAIGILAYCINVFGIFDVTRYYLIPYMIVNFYLVLITFLQHTDVYIPHFRGEEWNWLRGALCTVDRSFGPILDRCLHHISDTHVCHHIFSKMPFYHAQEATECIKKVIGKYYLADPTPISVALWRSYRLCKYVEEEDDIVFFKQRA